MKSWLDLPVPPPHPAVRVQLSVHPWVSPARGAASRRLLQSPTKSPTEATCNVAARPQMPLNEYSNIMDLYSPSAFKSPCHQNAVGLHKRRGAAGRKPPSFSACSCQVEKKKKRKIKKVKRRLCRRSSAVSSLLCLHESTVSLKSQHGGRTRDVTLNSPRWTTGPTAHAPVHLFTYFICLDLFL